jgi:anti-sigma B factor antagonist
MHYNIARLPNGVKAHLREELNIASVAEDRDHLVSLLQPSGELELDLGGVTEIDTAGVQLLVALRKEAESMGCVCHLAGSDEAVREAFGTLGLGHLLDEPLVGKGVTHGS